MDGIRVCRPGVHPRPWMFRRLMLIPGNLRFTTACGSLDSDARSSCLLNVPVRTMLGADSPVKHRVFANSWNRTTFRIACPSVYRPIRIR